MSRYHDRLGDLIREGLEADEDPFVTWEPHAGERRSAGKEQERVPPRKSKPVQESRTLVPVPSEMVPYFIKLGLPAGSSREACKTAWKNLLKKHHPDRYHGDARREKEASELCGTVTDAWRVIDSWFEKHGL